jgi:succinyl-CoA synthetase beta subunit
VTQLLEYQAKRLLADFGLPVPDGELARDLETALSAAEKIGYPVMVKSQVPVGGRGKAGGIRRADDPDALAGALRGVLEAPISGMTAVDALIEPCTASEQEIYLSATVDGVHCGPVIMFGAAGGIEVESAGGVEAVPLREDGTVPAARLRQVARSQGLEPRIAQSVTGLAEILARALLSTEARLIECNPVGITADLRLLALDVRVLVDESALPRHPALSRLVRARSVVPEEERIRDEARLEYVPVGGNIGLISGGAGMTMAAMDLIDARGGSAACFLDCSANPTPQGYGAALQILESDPSVDVILVSIFGGLTMVDRVARTFINLFSSTTMTKPVVCRLMGSNVDGADQALVEVGLTNYRHLEDAVDAAVELTAAVQGVR